MNSKEIIVGHGEYRYRVHADWGVPGAGEFPVKDCHEMVMDRQGRLYLLTNDIRNNILVYNKDGRIIAAWGNEFPGAHGLTISDENGEEFLFITDTEKHQVYKLSLDGRKVMTLDYPREISDYQDSSVYKPTETAIAANGDIYITDGYGLQFVIQYSGTGEYIRHWGGRGNGPANFDCAHGIAIDDRNKDDISLLITSRNQNAIRRFSLEGDYKGVIVLPGSFVCRPVVHHQQVYAAVFRSEHNQHPSSGYIQILDSENKVVSTPGGTAPVYFDGELMPQRKEGNVFIHPHDVCVDEDENLYIAQWNSNNTYPIKLERIR